MKILLFYPKVKKSDNFLVSDSDFISEIRNYRYSTEVVCANILFNLIKRGINVNVDRNFYRISDSNDKIDYLKKLPNLEYDHILAFGLKAFTWLPEQSLSILRKKLKDTSGLICDFHDEDLITGSDVTFFMKRSSSGIISEKNYYIGWAADPNLFEQKQNDKRLVIIVDHPHYTKDKDYFDKYDYTNKILLKLELLVNSKKWKSQFDEIEVIRLINNGIEVVDFSNLKESVQYNRRSLSHGDLADLLSCSFIFIPTHKETLGLTCLEAAMCGSLVLCQDGFISEDRLKTIDHIKVNFDNEIDWNSIIDYLNPQRSRKKAFVNNWDNLVSKMMEKLYE